MRGLSIFIMQSALYFTLTILDLDILVKVYSILQNSTNEYIVYINAN